MKYIVWVREAGIWEENGDGPLTKLEAIRIAREIIGTCGIRAKVLPVGVDSDYDAHSTYTPNANH